MESIRNELHEVRTEMESQGQSLEAQRINQRTLFDLKNQYIETLADYHAARTDIERFIAKEIDLAALSESEQ